MTTMGIIGAGEVGSQIANANFRVRLLKPESCRRTNRSQPFPFVGSRPGAPVAGFSKSV